MRNYLLLKPLILARTKSKADSAGFTVVELMIATMVFAVILLLVTFGIIQISRTYYKGVTETKTQTVARTVIDTISQDIQFQGSQVNPAPDPPPSNSYAICIGQHRYSVALGQKLIDGTNHALIVDTTASCNTTNPDTSLSNAGTELLAPTMRLAVLSVIESIPYPTSPNIKLYTIHVRVVYGDDDLLCSPNYDDCSSGINNFPAYKGNVPPDLTCKTQSGGQFCSAADFITTVQKRV